jgi:hypothetical protein
LRHRHPRGQAGIAYEDNFLGPLAQEGVLAFRGDSPRSWRLAAERLPFSFD